MLHSLIFSVLLEQRPLRAAASQAAASFGTCAGSLSLALHSLKLPVWLVESGMEWE